LSRTDYSAALPLPNQPLIAHVRELTDNEWKILSDSMFGLLFDLVVTKMQFM